MHERGVSGRVVMGEFDGVADEITHNLWMRDG